MADRCVCCGAIIPEGRQVCPVCELGYGEKKRVSLFERLAKRVFKRRKPSDGIVKVETNVFDKEEIYENCTVQVLTNTVTGEVSVGWWRND